MNEKSVMPSGSGGLQPKAEYRPSVAMELLRGNADALDRVHPLLGPGLFITSLLLLALGLWLKRRESRQSDVRVY